MTKLAFVLGVSLAAFGCGNKADEAIAKLESFADKMCECKDTECAEGVDKDWREYRKSMKDEIKKEDVSEGQKEKGDAAMKKFRECERTARGK